MQVAILSDIHGNRHALEAVLEDVARQGIADLWCLGDLVGYGADPDACVALTRRHAAVCLSGNHDMAVTGQLPLEDFSRGAAVAARWTQQTIGQEARAWLAGLQPSGECSGVGLFHGSPRDPVWEYVLSEGQAEDCLAASPFALNLVGHSHVALSFELDDEGIAAGAQRRPGDALELGARRWLLNPGSVGQPRDGDPRAAWLVLDADASTARWMRTDYDVAGAQEAIRAAGLPVSLADRLGYGQ